MINEYVKITIKFGTKKAAEKVLNPIFKMLVEGQYKDVEFSLDMVV